MFWPSITLGRYISYFLSTYLTKKYLTTLLKKPSHYTQLFCYSFYKNLIEKFIILCSKPKRVPYHEVANCWCVSVTLPFFPNCKGNSYDVLILFPDVEGYIVVLSNVKPFRAETKSKVKSLHLLPPFLPISSLQLFLLRSHQVIL